MLRNITPDGVVGKCFVKKVFLKCFTKFTENHLYQNLFFNKVAGLKPVNVFKKETLARVNSWESYEISKDTIFYGTPSGLPQLLLILPRGLSRNLPNI